MFRKWLAESLFTLAALFSLASDTQAQTASSGQLKLAHAAPEQCLMFVTWNGWTTSADPKSTNNTERLFAEQSVKDFISQLEAEIDKVIASAAAKDNSPETPVVAKAAPLLIKTALTHPGAILITSFVPAKDPQIEAAIVVDAGADSQKAIDAFKSLIDLAPKEGPAAAIEEKIGDATFFRPKEYRANMPRIRIGYRGTQLLATFGDDTAKTLVARLAKTGQPPAWMSKITTDLGVERPAMLTYFDIAGLRMTLQPIITDPMAPKAMAALGIDNLRSFSGVSGLDKTGMHSVALISTDGPPRGLFDLPPNKPLTIKDFEKIPANVTNASVFRFDLAYVFDQVMKGIGSVEPNVQAQIEQGLAQIEPQLGFSVRKDVLEGFGDTWSFYSSASEPGAMFFPGIVLTASIRNHDGVAKALNVVVAAANAALANSGPRAPFSILEFTARGEKGHRIQFNGVPVPVQPAWVLTKDQLVIGLTPQLVTAHLGAIGTESLASNEYVKAGFQWGKQPTSVSYSDPKPGLHTIYTLANTFGPFLTAQLASEGINFNLPPLPPLGDLTKHLHPSVTTFSRLPNGWRTESHGVIPSGVEVGPAAVAVGAALLLPAVQQAREATRRSRAKNNLKHLGLAMHNYHDTYHKFPANANYDKKGKALLSWRVHILPFIDQAPLYNEFHLDEPWDSEHNKKLIAKIPPVYVQPTHADLAKDGKTVYLAPVGKGLAFEGAEGMQIHNFTDGTSNTILLVEAHRDAAVIWTKPDDLTVDPKNPLKNLKSALVGGFHVLLCDGSVRFISDNIDVNVLNNLFTRGGGEVINFGALDGNVPGIAAVAAVPARAAVRVAAQANRANDPRNNFKQVGLAFHNFHDVHKRLPQRATLDKNGKPLLSWRVQLLPFLYLSDLYNQFHHDEPWDSPHNKTLIAKIPAVFSGPGDEELAKQGRTRVVSPANAEACLGAKDGTRFADIRDGTSNTILALEVRADAAVIWTKPDDVVIDFKDPLKTLKDSRNGKFMALMGDGSVRLIEDKIPTDTLKALITRDGGEVIREF